MESVGDRWEKMEGSCSTGQSPQRAVVPMEEDEEEEEEEEDSVSVYRVLHVKYPLFLSDFNEP
jgi:hypothetical protein